MGQMVSEVENPYAEAARLRKAAKLAAYVRGLGRQVAADTGAAITDEHLAKFVRGMTEAERDEACQRAGVNHSSDACWAIVLSNLEPVPVCECDPFLELEGGPENTEQKLACPVCSQSIRIRGRR